MLIGYFGPADPAHPAGGPIWAGALLALEDANQSSAPQGNGPPLRFRFVPAWSRNPWGSGVSQVTRLVYGDGVCALIGGIDGPSTHLAEQVVAKARLPLVSPVSTDPSVNHANVPWMFTCCTGDHMLAPVLVDALEKRLGKTRSFLLLEARDHDAHLFAMELKKACWKRRLHPTHHYTFRKDAEALTALAGKVLAAAPGAVIVAADAEYSARVAGLLRSRQFKGHLFGGPAMATQRFVKAAGQSAEGAIFPLPLGDDEKFARFNRRFQKRFDAPADYRAVHGYDAASLLTAAIRKSGPDKAGILKQLKAQSPWPGVSGTIEWDALGGNIRPARLGIIKQGRIMAHP